MEIRRIPEEPTVDQAPSLKLVSIVAVCSGKKQGVAATIDSDCFVIGRGRGCDLTLPDKEVSRRHAEIRLKGGMYVLRDLGSRWGTRLKGQGVTEAPLQYGDEFEVGGVLLKLDIQSKSALFGKKRRPRRIILYGLAAAALFASLTLVYFRNQVSHNLDRPAGDVLSQIIYHYDKGIGYYNRLGEGRPEDRRRVVEEMQKVIELDPEGKTHFSRSARRIIDGLEK